MTVRSIAGYLSGHPFFTVLDAASVRELAGCARNEHRWAGKYLFREGGTADHFYVVMHGRIALEVHNPGDRAACLGDGQQRRGPGLAMADPAAPVAVRRPGSGTHQRGIPGVVLPARQMRCRPAAGL
jgi:hypothetical protein